MIRDLRFALRLLGRTPGFTAVAILTLALGIGANTALFTVANALLLKPLPYPHPDRLLLLDAQSRAPLTWPRVRTIVEQSRSLAVAAFTRETFNLTGRGDPEQILAARVSWNFFDVLGVPMQQGRSFRPAEDRPGGDSVLIASQPFAARHGLRPGDRLTLDGKPYTVAGVLPTGFDFLRLGSGIELFAPRVFELNILTPGQIERGSGFLECVARLQPGVSIAAAQAELDTIAARSGPPIPPCRTPLCSCTPAVCMPKPSPTSARRC